jgi:hypothetical protein
MSSIHLKPLDSGARGDGPVNPSSAPHGQERQSYPDQGDPDPASPREVCLHFSLNALRQWLSRDFRFEPPAHTYRTLLLPSPQQNLSLEQTPARSGIPTAHFRRLTSPACRHVNRAEKR